MRLRRALIWLATAAFVALAALPAVVVFSQGWLTLPTHALLPGQQPAREGSPEAWTLFAVFYLIWIAADVALLVFLYDRAGFKYMPRDSKPRETRGKRRRRAVGLRYMAAREQAQAEAKAGARRRASRPSEPDPMAGRPPRIPVSERGRGGQKAVPGEEAAAPADVPSGRPVDGASQPLEAIPEPSGGGRAPGGEDGSPEQAPEPTDPASHRDDLEASA